MDSLRWWLLLLAAVMFSMSGCASKEQWDAWWSHPTHYASGNHMEFSQRTGGDIDPRIITAQDQSLAAKEGGWWGDLVPLAPTADFSGNWVGTWKGLGLFDSLRMSDARLALVQSGIVGAGQLYMSDTIAAGVPWPIRYAGSNGVRLGYRVRGADAEMREVNGAGAPMVLAFTMVDGKLVGTVVGGSPVVITLAKAPAESAGR
jgi:hypothetical protein